MSNNYVGIETTSCGFLGHLTILYLGDYIPSVSDLSALDMLDYSQVFGRRVGLAQFGLNNDVPVAIISLDTTSPIVTIRQKLLALGLIDNSEYEWTPHVTLNLESNIAIPLMFEFYNPYISIDGVRYHYKKTR